MDHHYCSPPLDTPQSHLYPNSTFAHPKVFFVHSQHPFYRAAAWTSLAFAVAACSMLSSLSIQFHCSCDNFVVAFLYNIHPTRHMLLLHTVSSYASFRLWVLAEDTALSLQSRPDILVGRFCIDQGDNDAFYQSLIKPEGPIKRSTPRIVVYPKGKKEVLLRCFMSAVPTSSCRAIPVNWSMLSSLLLTEHCSSWLCTFWITLMCTRSQPTFCFWCCAAHVDPCPAHQLCCMCSVPACACTLAGLRHTEPAHQGAAVLHCACMLVPA